jgi:thiamine-phosphate diphosphorylase
MTARDRRALLAAGRGLYLILTAPMIPHLELARAALERGVRVLQLREKNMPDPELLSLATKLAEISLKHGALFIVNDRADIAADAGADGVHLGRSDEDIAVARTALGPTPLVGLSTRTPDEAAAAAAAGADYIGVGPIFPTDTKTDALAPIGLPGIRAVSDRVPDLPKVAIGGITASSARDVLNAGAQYVAVISAVCHAPDPIAAVDAFMEVV